MNSRKGLHWLLLVSTILLPFSASFCHAETFVAKVKVTLVDPANAANISETQAMSLPIKQIENGQCTLDPESGQLTGNACVSTESQLSIISIDGSESLNVSVNLTEGHSPNLTFSPSLYNGQNQLNNFELMAKQHNISIGGTVTQISSRPADIATSPTQVSPQLNYGIEVLYP